MIEQQVLMDVDGQRSWVSARLDLREPLLASDLGTPVTIFGWLLNLEPHQRFQLAEGRTKRMVFNEGQALYVFTFSEQTGAFVAARESGREGLIAVQVDRKARAIREGTGEWGAAIVQEMRIAVPFEMSNAEFEFLEKYVEWRMENPL